MELKPGYKQTEVGVIPEEWEASTKHGRLDMLSSNSSSGRKLIRDSYVYGYGDSYVTRTI